MGIFNKKKEQSEEKLSIEKTNIIDGVAYDEKNKKLILLLSDGMDWHDELNHLLLLQEKINSYIAYIETEQYLEKYPDVSQIEIQLCFYFKETINCRKFLELVTKTIDESLKNTKLIIEFGIEETFK